MTRKNVKAVKAEPTEVTFETPKGNIEPALEFVFDGTGVPEYAVASKKSPDTRILNIMLKIVDACYESSGRGVVQPWKGIREEIERMMQ